MFVVNNPLERINHFLVEQVFCWFFKHSCLLYFIHFADFEWAFRLFLDDKRASGIGLLVLFNGPGLCLGKELTIFKWVLYFLKYVCTLQKVLRFFMFPGICRKCREGLSADW